MKVLFEVPYGFWQPSADTDHIEYLPRRGDYVEALSKGGDYSVNLRVQRVVFDCFLRVATVILIEED